MMENNQEQPVSTNAQTPNLKKNIAFNTFAKIFSYLTPLLIAPYVSRVLLSDGVGQYSHLNSLVYYFSIFIVFGFISFGTKSIGAVRDDKEKRSELFWNIFISRALLFTIFFALFILFSVFNIASVQNHFLLFAFIPFLVGNLLDVTFLFQGLEEFKIQTIIEILSNVIYLVCVFLLVKSIDDLLLYTILKSSVNLFAYCVMWIFVGKRVQRIKLSAKGIWSTIKGSFFFFLPAVIMTISPMVDQTMLGYLSGNSEVAYYEQSYKIISVVGALIYAISPVMLSRISYLYKKQQFEDARSKIVEIFRYVYFLIIPASAGLFCVSKFFIPAFFGDDFYPSIFVTYILSFSLLFSPISSIIINSYYYPFGKVKFVTILMAISVGSNLLLNIWAIRYLGARGAALTTLLTSIVAQVLYIIFSWKFIPYLKIWKGLWKILISTLVMVAVLLFFIFFSSLNNYLSTAIVVLVGTLTYLLVCLALKEECLYAPLRRLFKGKK